MSLSSDLISQFAKITYDNSNKQNTGTTAYGKVVEYDGRKYVQLDGSDLLTPVNSTVSVQNGDRVTVTIKDHTATLNGNLTDPSASGNKVSNMDTRLNEFDIIIANKISVDEFEAENANIRGRLTANEASISSLQSVNVDITGRLTANEADIKSLQTDKLDTTTANITYATIDNLNATNATVYNLQADIGSIDTLIFGSASGGTIQTSFANSVIAQLGNAQIKSAMIESLNAGKITAGDINTNNVRVISEDGKLLISDETIQISDKTRVRVQIGKDASNDYSINIWDVNGNLMFSEGGITDSAIKEAIIRNDMVNENANISANKLDISSLFDVINTDGSHTLKSSKILLDANAQTLDVAFTNMTSIVNDIDSKVITQGTNIATIQGQISSKIWQSDITTAINGVNADISSLSDKYTSIDQTVNGISATVASHTTTLLGKADSNTVTEVTNRVTNLEATANGLTSTVSSVRTDLVEVEEDVINAKSTADSTESRVSIAETIIQQLSDAIATLVVDGNGSSLMTQTSTGWQFDMSAIQSAIESNGSEIDTLNNSLNDTNNDVNNLQQIANTFNNLNAYVKIGTYNNEPCIELGKSDSEFKLLITNTKILFMQGNNTPAYLTNQNLYINQGIIENELQIGSFVWKKRTNGNTGLVWKGGTN